MTVQDRKRELIFGRLQTCISELAIAAEERTQEARELIHYLETGKSPPDWLEDALEN